jgi:transcriptional regulator with XRE-family HTH domain
MIKVYDNILKLRKSKGLSQLDVSEKLGINQDTYSKLERGKIQLTIERLHQISEILGVSVDDILYYKEDTLTKADLEIKVRYLETQNKLLEQGLINQTSLMNVNDNTREGGLLHEHYKELREGIKQKDYVPIKINNAEDLKISHYREMEISRKAFRQLLDIHPILEKALEYGLISESWIIGLWTMLNSK